MSFNETQFTANTGIITISTANTNLDGSGTMGLVLTAASNGTFIKSVIIKAQVTTSIGMIRLFVKNASNNHVNLLLEIKVPKVPKSGTVCSYQNVIPLNYTLLAGDMLYASTQNAEAFNIIAEGLNWTYPQTPRSDATEYTANTGAETISTANSNLDGSGTIVQIFQAASSTFNGCEVSSINIKGQQTVTAGMVRLYLKDGANTAVLFSEVAIPSTFQDGSSGTPSFSFEVINQGSLAIKPGLSIYASTQNAEAFSVIIEGNDWDYP